MGVGMINDYSIGLSHEERKALKKTLKAVERYGKKACASKQSAIKALKKAGVRV